jgi:cytochrome P450
MTHAFSEKALRSQEQIMKHYVDMFIAKLGERTARSEALDIVRWYNFVTFDMIGDLAFGEPFGCLENGKYHPWVAMIFQSLKLGIFSEVFQRYPYLKPLAALLVPKRLVRSRIEHWELSRQTAERRVGSGNVTREDFMSYILRHNDERGMTHGEIIENTNVLIIAGSKTLATLLSGATFYLLTNRDKYEKLVKEIRGAFEKEDDITLAQSGNLLYLNAVIEEAFRICTAYPLSPNLFRRASIWDLVLNASCPNRPAGT